MGVGGEGVAVILPQGHRDTVTSDGLRPRLRGVEDLYGLLVCIDSRQRSDGKLRE